ncbi:hypothetical protein LI90_4347 (plasmid) [Carbonactinospora thermoautotrophica]|uniref:Uncharacterized protein n=1 Tax=Carbonactinospora thermoautotrophica TaxID=1469144 RepID=A0A132MHY3_9ACTN|nr:hypothetical protein [Carbonactinospora thermoautotrophica]KWW97375.1 hypothetical protein LI90_4347 [Carbonactinospora thermoautotrophica]
MASEQRRVVLELDDDTLRIVVDALLAAAETRTRAARRAAGEVEADRAAGRDVRSAAVRIVRVLGEAERLRQVAEQITATPETPDTVGSLMGDRDGESDDGTPDVTSFLPDHERDDEDEDDADD